MTQSRNTSLVGCKGIIIHETENTFKVVTAKNALKGQCFIIKRVDMHLSYDVVSFSVVPKENSIFTFDVPLYAPPPLDLSVFRPPESATPLTYISSEVTSHEAAASSSTLPPPRTASMPSLPAILDDVPKIRFELYGNQFRFRSSDRATRKFKPKETIEL